MSSFRPAHLTFAWRVWGPWAHVWQRAGPQREALAIWWVTVTNADRCRSEGMQEQG